MVGPVAKNFYKLWPDELIFNSIDPKAPDFCTIPYVDSYVNLERKKKCESARRQFIKSVGVTDYSIMQ